MDNYVSMFKDYYEVAVIILAIIGAIAVKSRKKKESVSSENSPQNNIGENSENPQDGDKRDQTYIKVINAGIHNGVNMTKAEIKQDKKVLFIDDNNYPIIKLLKKNGWNHVKLINDPDSLNSDDITSADIIFVDVIGVGKVLGFQDQGFGLAIALKESYPNKKVILYSQEKNNFHKAIKKVDAAIEKTSNIYDIENEILSLFGVGAE
ncbi:hypothetical protein JMT66_23900 (plasmid) [Kosakonia cowanii]|uniref:hypothetical protein n=1 Tax=Kosakonia cowanii TaxID=208223 RepID=UPI001E59BA9E|nr:hypothetical protein [Kosakonia cowanii]UGS48669.1 hypothetical protein JMT66_23900 [Kosakonia cowanii]